MKSKRIRNIISSGIALTLALFALPAFADYGDVSTYVSKIYAGDGGNAKNAYLDFHEDIAFDTSGNMFIADTYNNVIRKIDTGGTISTFAGTGSYGDVDGAAAQAKFALPRGIAVDGNGVVFVSDAGNKKVKKIEGGVVSTIVSSGINNPDGLVPLGGDVIFTDSSAGKVFKVGKDGSNLTQISGSFTEPRKIETDADGVHVYVTDPQKHQIFKLNVNTTALELIAGSGADAYADGIGAAASFQDIVGVTRNGNTLYVADGDELNDRIRSIDLGTRQVTELFWDPEMDDLNSPRGMEFRNGNIYVGNAGLSQIQIFDTSGNLIEKFAGQDRFGNTNGSNADAVLGRPYALVISPDGTKMFSAQNNQVKQINLQDGSVEHILGTTVDAYREGAGDRIRFSTITGITIDSTGENLYVADHWNNRIRKINIATKTSSLISGTGETNCIGSCNGYADGTKDVAKFDNPSDLVISKDNQYLYVTDTANNRIREVRISDGQTRLIAGSGQAAYGDGIGAAAHFNRPYGITMDSSGAFLFVADSNNHRIRKVDIATGGTTTLAGSGNNGFKDAFGIEAFLSFPEYLDYGADGNIYFSEVGSQRIKLVKPSTGQVITVAGTGNRGFSNSSRFNSAFNNPKGLAADTANNRVFVADSWNDLVRQIDVTGEPVPAEPAPTVNEVLPTSRFRVAGNQSDTKMLEISGTNIRHGATAYFGPEEVNQAFVKSSEALVVEVPFGKLAPGYYTVTIKNVDGQSGSKADGFIVLNSDGSLPERIQYAERAQTQFNAYFDFLRGGYNVTAGQLFGGTGTEQEIVTGLGVGFGPQVRTFGKDGNVKSQFFPYAKFLRSGVRVATCDLTGNGVDDIVTAPGPGGRPHIRTFDREGNAIITPGFFALDGKFQGGANIACEDVNGDGKVEIIVAASPGGGPHVTVHAPTGRVIANFFAYGKTFRGGIRLGVADLNGDGVKQIVTGPEKGAPHVQLFAVEKGGVRRLTPGFFPFHPNFRGGITVAGGDTTGDGKDELVVSQRSEGQGWVKVYRGKDQAILKNFLAYDSNFNGGAVVGTGDVDNDGRAEVLTMPGSEGGPQVRVFDVEQ